MSIKLSKLLFFTMLFLSGASVSYAFSPVIQTPEQPYQAIEIDALETSHWWLGSLDGFPDLYEFTISEPTSLTLQLSQVGVGETVPFQLLVVRQNDTNGGVTEVLRQTIPIEEWQSTSMLALGVSLANMPVLTESLEPGTYRVEVSAPNNDGAYMLYAGSTLVSSWFISLSDLFIVHSHFETSLFRIFLSVYTLLPLFIVLSAGIWYWRRKTYA